MNQTLVNGQTVTAQLAGLPVTVKKFLGEGGQGDVYLADQGGSDIALKWYKPESATAAQFDGLSTLIRKGSPDKRFLWPQDLVQSNRIAGFGYIMPLRGPQFKSIIDLMKGRIAPSFQALATAGYQLADSFLQLHAKGLSYCDISFGNVFFDENTGDIQICDCDNVVIDNAVVGVAGTPRFMAPEIVLGKGRPNTQTDQFSLAVLLFYMQVMHHPLFGAREAAVKCLDLPALTKLCGEAPLFIFDPKDQSNRPDPNYQGIALTYWALLPQFLQAMFTRSFTEGLGAPASRIRDSEWKAAMIRLRDSIVYCARCTTDPKDPTQNFYDADALRAANGVPGSCFNCKRTLVLPPRIRIGNAVVMLNFDTKLYPHHTDNARLFDFSSPTAEVTAHPTLPNVWGLRNLSANAWTFVRPEGTSGEVGSGQSVPISKGTTVHFGTVEGTIQV